MKSTSTPNDSRFCLTLAAMPGNSLTSEKSNTGTGASGLNLRHSPYLYSSMQDSPMSNTLNDFCG